MKTLSIKNNITLKELTTIAKELKKNIIPPQVILLSGPLGSGKTTLIRLMLNQEKIKNVITSPSFSVHNYYITNLGSINHIDLYRIKNDEDLESTGFWDVFSESHKKSLIIIEWADRLDINCFPPLWNYLKVDMNFGDQQNTRSIKIQSF